MKDKSWINFNFCIVESRRRPCLLEARPVIALSALKWPAVTLAAGVGVRVSLRVERGHSAAVGWKPY